MKRTSATLFLALAATGMAQDFSKEILPILKDKCFKCHSAPHEVDGRMKKPKGGLALDSVEGILGGESENKAVVPGDVTKSYILHSISLPQTDEDAMPPEGKGDPVKPEDIELIKKWIEGGANFGDWKSEPLPTAEAAPAAGETPPPPAEGAAHPAAPEATAVVTIYDTLAKGVVAAPEAAVKAVSDANGRVLPLAQDNPLVRVDFLMKRKETTDANLAALAGLAANLTELNLGETQVTSAGLASLGGLKILTRLDLHKTKVTDDGIAQLQGLTELRYLNLYGTEVTDAGLEALGGLANLQNLYLWQTKVTEAGVKKLSEKIPNAKINWQ